MKKVYLFTAILFVVGKLTAQTVLNRFPLELKKSSEYFQISNAANTKNEYFTFISDKEKLTVLKYNSGLFFTDSISMARPDKKFDFMAGTTFSADGTPNLYWASKTYQNLKMIHFDFENHTCSYLIYENDFARNKIIDVFTAKNALTIISISPENNLLFSTFSNTGKNDYTVSLDLDKSANAKSDAEKFANAILKNGLTIIEAKQFNPLYLGTAKVKRYLQSDKYVLGFDLDNATTLLTIDLSNFSSTKTVFPYEKLDKKSGANSFLHQGILYQLTANSKSLSLTGINLETQNSIANYTANAESEIDFKNSPLLLQSENGNGRELKNTAKLLSKINLDQIGLSVYATPNYNLFTIGGVREVASSGGVALGIGLGIAGVMAGSDVFVTPDYMSANMQSLYFESFFDDDFKHLNVPFRPLYVDALSDFLNNNKPVVQNVYPYKNYFILNYYDIRKKEFVMRKFEDVRD